MYFLLCLISRSRPLCYHVFLGFRTSREGEGDAGERCTLSKDGQLSSTYTSDGQAERYIAWVNYKVYADDELGFLFASIGL